MAITLLTSRFSHNTICWQLLSLIQLCLKWMDFKVKPWLQWITSIIFSVKIKIVSPVITNNTWLKNMTHKWHNQYKISIKPLLILQLFSDASNSLQMCKSNVCLGTWKLWFTAEIQKHGMLKVGELETNTIQQYGPNGSLWAMSNPRPLAPGLGNYLLSCW